MGYDYNWLSGNGRNSNSARLYGSTFGCFAFPQQTTLPIKLISFSGSYRNQAALLNWETENQLNFDHFEIERSSNGANFTAVADKPVQSAITGRQQYQHTDDLSSADGNVFYYRLKMVDVDGKSKYSNVIMIRKESRAINGISINPNPVINGGMATVRFTSASVNIVNFRVLDMSGRVMLTQQNKIFEGTNSISINNLDHLQPGMYVLQMNDGETAVTTKFSIVR